MHELIDVFPPGDNNQHICTAEQPALEDGDGETDGSRGARGKVGGGYSMSRFHLKLNLNPR